MLDDTVSAAYPDGVTPGPNGSLLLKLTQSESAEIVERLRESHAAAAGRAFIIRLDALIERLGDRWEMKRELVFSHLKTSFERKFAEPDWCIKINDDTFLAILLTIGEHKGALSAAELWFGAGQFFVGDVSKIVPPLYEVTVKDVDLLNLIPIDLAKYFDRAQARPFRAPDAPLPQAAEDAARAPSAAVGVMHAMRKPAASGMSFVIGGRNLRVASSLEAVFEMKKMAIIGYRFEPMVMESGANVALDPRALAGMDWGDREQIDVANIEQGLKLLAMKAPDQRKMMMVVPAAFSTLANARARTRITTEVTRASRAMGLKVLFEIRNLTGVPVHRIQEIIGLIRPSCMTVMGHVGNDSKAVSVLNGCGLAGVVFDYDGIRRDDAALEMWLSPLNAVARAATGACMVRGFSSLHEVAVGRLVGISHASVRSAALMATR